MPRCKKVQTLHGHKTKIHACNGNCSAIVYTAGESQSQPLAQFSIPVRKNRKFFSLFPPFVLLACLGLPFLLHLGLSLPRALVLWYRRPSYVVCWLQAMPSEEWVMAGWILRTLLPDSPSAATALAPGFFIRSKTFFPLLQKVIFFNSVSFSLAWLAFSFNTDNAAPEEESKNRCYKTPRPQFMPA